MINSDKGLKKSCAEEKLYSFLAFFKLNTHFNAPDLEITGAPVFTEVMLS